mmetsp:Transcript_109750/g.305888  ORF Transcript_109750/g.305888 Transcript_109750/m.305888 type:complete len:235 (-) Transcript_109750:323-1027(-)
MVSSPQFGRLSVKDFRSCRMISTSHWTTPTVFRLDWNSSLARSSSCRTEAMARVDSSCSAAAELPPARSCAEDSDGGAEALAGGLRSSRAATLRRRPSRSLGMSFTLLRQPTVSSVSWMSLSWMAFVVSSKYVCMCLARSASSSMRPCRSPNSCRRLSTPLGSASTLAVLSTGSANRETSCLICWMASSTWPCAGPFCSDTPGSGRELDSSTPFPVPSGPLEAPRAPCSAWLAI